MRFMRWPMLALFVCVLLTGGCNGRHGDTVVAPDELPTAMRADPGYVQWLEKQAMLRQAQDMARIVSGTTISWLSPSVTPRPQTLLEQAPVWLRLHPASLLPENNTPLFKYLQHPEFWKQFSHMGLRGLMVAPVRESGGVWGYDISGTQALGADPVQYGFARYAGTEADFRQLLRLANNAGAIMGDMLIPAATGRGADFFLSARFKPEYQGVYCMMELPRDVWPMLPVVHEQWQAESLDASVVEELRRQRILPPPRQREAMKYPLARYGWAATGEVRGIDGTTRRFAYLFSGSPDRPVLHWTDPSASARRILSGSIIQQIGTLGVAFSGMSVAPLLGMDPAAGQSQSDVAYVASAQNAAQTLAQEIRRYGGWSYLQDAVPLPVLAALLREGPEMALDHAGAVSAQVALLTGDASMLRETLGAAQALGLDRRRLVHVIQPDGGLDLRFVHLYGAANDAAAPLRLSSRKAVDAVVREAGADVFVKNDVLYTSPAGVAGIAAGLRDLHTLDDGQRALLRDGLLMLATYHAMQPGIFMLSGRELCGSLPVPPKLITAASEDEALQQNMAGGYDLLGTSRGTLLTALGMPKAPAAFGSWPEQMLDPLSFAWGVKQVLQVRAQYHVASAEPLGMLPAANRGVVVQAFRLRDSESAQGTVMVVAANFGATRAVERITAAQIPGLKLAAVSRVNEPLTDIMQVEPSFLSSKQLELPLAPWQTRVLLLERTAR